MGQPLSGIELAVKIYDEESGSATFWKGPEKKHFGLCGPCMVSVTDPSFVHNSFKNNNHSKLAGCAKSNPRAMVCQLMM